MKIGYCIDSLKSSGGTERVLTTKVNWLAARPEHQVFVFTLREAEEPFFRLDGNVKTVELDARPGDKRVYRAALRKALAETRPDVTVSVSGMSAGILPSLAEGGKKVLEFHYTKNFLVNFVRGIDRIRFRQLHILKMLWLQRKLARDARKFDLFVGLTKKDVGLWGNPKNMTFVHNPLSFRSERKSTCRNRTIIAVGSWTPAKGMDRLLEAFGPLAASYPEWRVELYGSGQDENRLKGIVAKYDMSAQVSLNAPVRNIGEKLVEASVYAFPSRSDGFGLVITEAMECGLPTVAMDCPCGPCEIVTERTGFVVPDGDVAAFRDALRKLMDDEELRMRMGRAAAEEVKRFYPDTIMPKWLELFRK